MASLTFTNIRTTDENVMSFTLSPIHVSYANTIRRLVLTGVESVAFRANMMENGATTDVVVHHNDTVLTNETLAHRVGLIPIHIHEPLKWNADKYIFKLDVSNKDDKVKDIVAGDFKVYELPGTDDASPVETPSQAFFVPHPLTKETCIIATLPPGEKQRLNITAKATIGTGRENAQFIPVSQCSYEYTRDTDPVKIKRTFEQWLLKSKKVEADTLSHDSDGYATFMREFNTMEVSRCYLKDDNNEPYSYDFTIETLGILDIPYIVKRACEVGEIIAGKYVSIGTNDLPEELTVTPSEGRVVGYDFIFRGHDHTLGNLIQTWLVQNHIDGTALPRVTYAGYKIPHPLQDEMLLIVGVEDGKESTAREAVAEACRGVVGMFRNLINSWERAIGGGKDDIVVALPTPRKTVTLRRKPVQQI